jgi:hypothetical protein
MTSMTGDLLTKVESLKNMLVSRATGGFVDDAEYKQLRRELLAVARIKDKLPRFVETCRSLDEFWDFIKPMFAHYAERREYLRDQFHALLAMLEAEANTPSDEVTSAVLTVVNSAHVQDAWRKALERRATDPEGAITAARTLLECVCKHVLDEAGAEYDNKDDLPKLYRKAAEQLNLAPNQHTEQLFRQILGGCQTVVEGLGALRNQLSDAHGRGKGGAKPASRHAELAVNLAGTMATFLIQTQEARRKK